MDEAVRVIARLKEKGLTLATAESCTGGLLGKRLTDVAGSSAVYLGGVISYAYAVKEALLGVDAALLREKGAVCAEVAEQMACGVRTRLHSDVSLATTGNAGPGTYEKNHKVGEIFIACATKSRCTVQKLELSGSRPENREEACTAALELLIECIS